MLPKVISRDLSGKKTDLVRPALPLARDPFGDASLEREELAIKTSPQGGNNRAASRHSQEHGSVADLLRKNWGEISAFQRYFACLVEFSKVFFDNRLRRL